MKPTLTYLRNLLLLPFALLDFAGNTILLMGSPFETMSRHAGRVKQFHGSIPKWRPVMRLIDWIVELFDDNHLLEAAGHEIGSLGVIDKPRDLEVV